MAVGKPGSGKSWAVLRTCYELDHQFTLEGNWFFKASQFMRAVKDYYAQEEFDKGKIWVLDEAGVDLNNLSYFDELNKALNLFFQIGRHRNYIFFGTVPFLSFISKGVRKLMTTVYRCEGWSQSSLKSTLHPLIIQYNDEMDKFYKRRLLVRTPIGIQICNKILVKRPPFRLRNSYEVVKKEFTVVSFEDIADKLEFYEEKQKEKYFGKKPTRLQQDILERFEEGNSMVGVSKEIKRPLEMVYAAMERLREKGYDFKEVKPHFYQVVNHRDKLKKRKV